MLKGLAKKLVGLLLCTIAIEEAVPLAIKLPVTAQFLNDLCGCGELSQVHML